MVFVIGSGIFFALPSAEAAGAIEGEFKLGEVLDESIGWFIVVGPVSYTHLTLPTNREV